MQPLVCVRPQDKLDTRKHVHSRAYHAAKLQAAKDGKGEVEMKEIARAAAKAAVEVWEEHQQ